MTVFCSILLVIVVEAVAAVLGFQRHVSVSPNSPSYQVSVKCQRSARLNISQTPCEHFSESGRLAKVSSSVLKPAAP